MNNASTFNISVITISIGDGVQYNSYCDQKTSTDLNVPYLGKIPIDPKIVDSGDLGQHYIIKDKKSVTAKSFEEIVNNIEKNIKKVEVK